MSKLRTFFMATLLLSVPLLSAQTQTTAGTLQVLVPDAVWAARAHAAMPEALIEANGLDMGRELFSGMRRHALTAEEGACSWL